MHGNIEITEIEMKEAKKMTHIEHKMCLGRTQYGKNLVRRWGLCSAPFLSVMKCKYKERDNNYGDVMDIVT